MGKYKPGVFGPFSGAVGDVVASTWKGINVVKNFPKPSSKPPTLAMLTQQQKFGLVTGFLTNLGSVISLGYQAANKTTITPMNAATKLLLSTAVTGAYPAFTLDYSKVELSKKDRGIDGAVNPVAVAAAGGLVNISWELDQYADVQTLPTDQAWVVLYNPDLKRYTTTRGKVLRSALKAAMPVSTYYFAGKTMHCWIFFASADGKLVSECTYVSAVKIIA